MAITRALLTSGTNTTDAVSFTTASITPVANKLYFVAIMIDPVGTTNPAPTVTGCGLTWVLVDQTLVGSSARSVHLFRAMGAAPTTGALTITTDATSTMGSIIWDVLEYSGTDTTGTNGSGAIVQSMHQGPNSTAAPSGSLPSAVTAGNETFAIIGTATQQAVSAGTGWTLLDTQQVATPAMANGIMYANPPLQTVTASTPTAQNAWVLACEIKASAAQAKTKVGATTVASAYVGATAVSKMYVGATQIFP